MKPLVLFIFYLQVLNFLAKPMEHPGARYVIYLLYARQHQYPIIVEYLQRLAIRDEVVSKDQVEIRTNFDKENAMFCSEGHLQGNCRLIQKVWKTRTFTITFTSYISHGLKTFFPNTKSFSI